MGSKFVVLSDIHANLSALKAVIQDFKEKYRPDGVIILGDLVNYGMRPNEVISEVKLLSLEFPVICNLHGNHERALVDSEQLPRFSSERGRAVLEYTKGVLTSDSLEYIHDRMEAKGYSELLIHGCSILCVHGSLRDVYWGKLSSESMKEEGYTSYLQYSVSLLALWLFAKPLPPSSSKSQLQRLSLTAQSPCGAANTAQLTKGPVASLIEELVNGRLQWRYF